MNSDEGRYVRFGDGRLAGVLHSPYKEALACIVTCHGLYSSKDSEKYISIAHRFIQASKQAFAVFRFDFTGCGESEGNFKDTTLTRRIEDLEYALDFLEQQAYENIGVMGSSLGGCVSILTAEKDRRIKALTTWATPYYFKELFTKEAVRDLPKLWRDIQRYNMAKAVKKVNCPIMIIHGSSDELVPISHAYALHDNANEPKVIRIIEGGDHRFTNPSHRKRAIELTLGWFKSYLK